MYDVTSLVTIMKVYYIILYIYPYANKVNCAVLFVKSKDIVQDSFHYLAFGPIVQVLSTPWADSTVV